MKVAFDIKYKNHIESGEYGVICDGKPIQIVKWDCKGPCPILCVKDGDDGRSDAMFFKNEGCTLNEKFWLYVDIPTDYNEFEWAVSELIERIDIDYAVTINNYEEYIKEFAPKIMSAAISVLSKKENLNDRV